MPATTSRRSSSSMSSTTPQPPTTALCFSSIPMMPPHTAASAPRSRSFSSPTPHAPSSTAPSRSTPRNPTRSPTTLHWNWPRAIPQHAQELLTKAVAAGAHDAATYQQLALADQQTQHPAEAEAALRSAIAADPSDPTSHSLLAQSARRTRRSRRTRSLSSRPLCTSTRKMPTAGATSASSTHNPDNPRRRATTSNTPWPSTLSTPRPARTCNASTTAHRNSRKLEKIVIPTGAVSRKRDRRSGGICCSPLTPHLQARISRRSSTNCAISNSTTIAITRAPSSSHTCGATAELY